MNGTFVAEMSPQGRLFIRPADLTFEEKVAQVVRKVGSKFKEALLKGIIMLAGFLPDEGEEMLVKWAAGEANVDRGTNLDLVLFTNVSPGETITAATLTQPSGGGYATITLTDGSWTGSGSSRSYAQQTFSFTGTVTGSVQGYAILSKGTTARIVAIEVDSNGPYSFVNGDTYKVTPTLTGQ